MNDIVKYIEQIGEVHFVRSKKARYIRISMSPFKAIRVTVPRLAKIEEAESFVRKKKSWILKQKKKIQIRESEKTIFRPETDFCTKSHQLTIVPSNIAENIDLKIDKGLIKVSYPEHLSIEDPKLQEIIRYGIEEALRFEAKQYLPKRTKELAAEHGLKFKKVFIKNSKGRWGSCSGVNNINYSLHLMRLPEHLIDYVILHELAHTIEKNHGPKFWKLLDKISGNAKSLDKELKNYGASIY